MSKPVTPSEARQNLDFGEALALLKEGRQVAREGWNGRNMYLYLVPGSTFIASRSPLDRLLGEGSPVSYRAHIDMRTAQGDFVPWVASQTDLLAEDWVIVDVLNDQARREGSSEARPPE